MPDAAPRIGRPPSERSRQAILDATLEILVESGYAGLTMDAVAARARAGKATIYRNWPSRPALVVDAVHNVSLDFPDGCTDDLREDLSRVAKKLIAALGSPPMSRVMPTLLDAGTRDDELGELVSAFVRTRRQHSLDCIARARERGEIPVEVSGEFVPEMMVGAILIRSLVLREPLTDADAAPLVDAALRALHFTPRTNA